jgi:catechol 2,3-dioxygenase-like lactoylglutathione lyase family enzyme
MPSPQPPVHPVALDHAVLRVADVERSLAFYVDVLGGTPVRVDEWRRGDAPFPSVRIADASILDLVPLAPGESHADAARQRVDHVCIAIQPCDLDELATALAGAGVDVRGEPVSNFGARGLGDALYIADPDGLMVELKTYGWADQGS